MKIYFAGSIRGGREDRNLYFEIIKMLSSYGKVLTEHIGDKTLSALGDDGPTEEYIYNRDIKWLKECDYVIAEVTTPSLGVGYEIAKAEEWNKKILCLYRDIDKNKRLSAMLTGSPSLEVINYNNLIELENVFSEYFQRI